MTSKLWILVACGVGMCPRPAEALSWNVTKASICENTTVAIIGTVSASTSNWTQDSSGTVITSEVTFTVERTLHGNASATLTVHAMEGTIDDLQYREEGTPNFEVGDRYLLLLHQPAGGPLLIIGDGDGAIRLLPSVSLPS